MWEQTLDEDELIVDYSVDGRRWTRPVLLVSQLLLLLPATGDVAYSAIILYATSRFRSRTGKADTCIQQAVKVI